MDKKITWIVIIVVIVIILIGGAGAGAVYLLAKKAVSTPTPSASPTPCTNCGQSPSPTEMTLEEVKASHCLQSPNGGTGNITIANLAHYSTVDSPVFIEGTANVFEGNFMIRLVGCDGAKISEVNAQSESGEVGVSNPYSVSISYNDSYIGTFATLEAYDLSAMDGSTQDLIQVPVYLK